MTAASILIVDDHPVFAAGFAHMARALRPEWRLRCAGDGFQALEALREVAADLAVVDVCLPGEDGFAVLGAIRHLWPAQKVLLMSGRVDEAVRVRARSAGAAGFVAKTAAPDAIILAAETVLGGGLAFAPAPPGAVLPAMTPRQAEVLALLAEGHANKEIRHRLGIAERTVRAHLTELFHLLGANSRMQAVIRGRELGLIE